MPPRTKHSKRPLSPAPAHRARNLRASTIMSRLNRKNQNYDSNSDDATADPAPESSPSPPPRKRKPAAATTAAPAQEQGYDGGRAQRGDNDDPDNYGYAGDEVEHIVEHIQDDVGPIEMGHAEEELEQRTNTQDAQPQAKPCPSWLPTFFGFIVKLVLLRIFCYSIDLGRLCVYVHFPENMPWYINISPLWNYTVPITTIAPNWNNTAEDHTITSSQIQNIAVTTASAIILPDTINTTSTTTTSVPISKRKNLTVTHQEFTFLSTITSAYLSPRKGLLRNEVLEFCYLDIMHHYPFTSDIVPSLKRRELREQKKVEAKPPLDGGYDDGDDDDVDAANIDDITSIRRELTRLRPHNKKWSKIQYPGGKTPLDSKQYVLEDILRVLEIEEELVFEEESSSSTSDGKGGGAKENDKWGLKERCERIWEMGLTYRGLLFEREVKIHDNTTATATTANDIDDVAPKIEIYLQELKLLYRTLKPLNQDIGFYTSFLLILYTHTRCRGGAKGAADLARWHVDSEMWDKIGWDDARGGGGPEFAVCQLMLGGGRGIYTSFFARKLKHGVRQLIWGFEERIEEMAAVPEDKKADSGDGWLFGRFWRFIIRHYFARFSTPIFIYDNSSSSSTTSTTPPYYPEGSREKLQPPPHDEENNLNPQRRQQIEKLVHVSLSLLEKKKDEAFPFSDDNIWWASLSEKEKRLIDQAVFFEVKEEEKKWHGSADGDGGGLAIHFRWARELEAVLRDLIGRWEALLEDYN